jgi:hypothetical protein
MSGKSMNRVAPGTVVTAVIISLVVGGIAGFFLGLASTKAGKAIVQGIFNEEKKAEVSQPKKLAREKFEIQYPSNWKIDTEGKDYDPDHMFSIESPGSAFVMFVIGPGETVPEDTLKEQIRQFEKLMGSPDIERFERYGGLTGKGATLKGRILGIRTTAKLFAFHEDGLTVMITQSCPDEDLQPVQAGFSLIENSFTLKAHEKKKVPDKPESGDGK